MTRQRKPKKSDRDKIASNAKILTSLLLWEASGGTIPLPKGMEAYKDNVPKIGFPERRALLDSISRLMITDMKVDPEEEMSGFDLLRGGYGNKRDSAKDSNGGIPSEAIIAEDEFADDIQDGESTPH